MGFVGDYFVSPNWSTNSTYVWNSELAFRFGMLMEHTRPDVVVFDGTWPFQGFLATCKAYRHPVKLVWSNRSLRKKNAKPVSVDKTFFDLVMLPGELGSLSCVHSVDGVQHLKLPPVLLLDSHELLAREVARKKLGLPLGDKLALFSLGAGNINDVSVAGLRLIREIQAKGYSIVWACAPISVRDIDLPSTIYPLTVYPLAQYLRAFDIFIGAAGYNTCCEVAQAQIPSLIVPNMMTAADDQLARAHLLEQYAPVVVSTCETDDEASEAVRALLALSSLHSKEEAMSYSLNGAELAAEALWKLTLR